MKKLVINFAAVAILVMPLAVALPAMAATAPITDTLGSGASSTSGQQNNMFAGQITASASGALLTVGIDFQSAGTGHARVAVYSDNNGAPGALLAQSESVLTATGWDDIPVTGVNIVSGNKYWIAEQFDSASDLWYYTAGTPSTYYNGYGYQDFPSNIDWNVNTNVIETRMTYEPLVTTKNQCMKSGWMTFVDSAGHSFKNQGDCVSFVATNGTNLGAGN